MKSTTASNLDYGQMLSELLSRREKVQLELKHLNNAIGSIERIISASGVGGTKLTPVTNNPSRVPFMTPEEFSKLGVYEAACYTLVKEQRPLTTQELMFAMNKAGKPVEMSQASILFRAIKDRGAKSLLTRYGEGKAGRWSLVDWSGDSLS